MNEIGKGFIILFIAVGGFKYITWNFHKLEQSAEVTSRIKEAPPAVNLIILKEKQVLFKKSFPYNSGGKYYIVNRFDISPYIPGLTGSSGNSLELTVNRQPIKSFLLFRFERFNILYSVDHTFVFTTVDSEIEDLLRLRKWMPSFRAVLLKLALRANNQGNTGDKKNGENITGDSVITLEKGKDIYSLPLPASPKGEIFEITFEYSVTGRAEPLLFVSNGPRSGGDVFFLQRLAALKKGSYRKAGFLFRVPDNMDSPVFQFAARFRGHRPDKNGEVRVRNISVSRLGNERIFQQAVPLVASLAPSVYYSEVPGGLEAGFIEFIREPGDLPR